MSEELNLYGLVNKPPIDEIFNLDLVNKPPLVTEDDELAHYGILKMKWGVRRYQNPDGSLTPLGKKRAAELRQKAARKEAKAAKKREKMIRNPNEKYINKNLEKFTDDEIRKALSRLDMKKSLENMKKDRLKIGQDKVNTLLGYGDTLNNALKFINSDAGRAIRSKLGLGSDKVFNFYEREKQAKELADEKRNFAYEMAREDKKKEREFKWDMAKKDREKQRDLQWDITKKEEYIKRGWTTKADIRANNRNNKGNGFNYKQHNIKTNTSALTDEQKEDILKRWEQKGHKRKKKGGSR